MQFSQALGAQPFQGRQLASGAMQHGLGQTQLNQGNQLNRHLNQFSNPGNNALFSAAQTTPNSQMVINCYYYLLILSFKLHRSILYI